MVSIDISTLRLHPIGDLTIYQVEEATKGVLALLASAEEVSVDLSEIDKIDTAGFQLLISLQKSCLATKKRFEITGMGESIEKFMTLFGYEWDFEYKGAR